ncbi:MAG: ABC transporter permease, partial [Trebonia sp.]
MLVPLARRLGLMILTLWVLSVIVFFAGQVLPGDPGRAILGNLASQSAVHALDHQLGADQPLPVRYLSWVGGMLRGDMGTSYSYQAPVAGYLGAALLNSLKLAALAFVVVVPLGIAGGVTAALRAGRPADRIISLAGLSAATVPEFVSGIVVIVIFSTGLHWLPSGASAGPGASVGAQFEHLILPTIPLVMVLFGYIARMARAGTIEALG